jgi:lipopolysaccharide/colanic/teichoic acid biosynthesis glycosyltransferase
MWVKRVMDLCLAAAALLLLWPVLLIVAVAVRSGLGGPVLFRQLRGGYRGRTFHVLKFRTMTDARDEHGHLLPDAVRLTRLGHFLRSSSLDELPQLMNVLRGDMSFVGPRPLDARYLARYSPEQARRHEVRPGITGWAQVNGRNELSWPDRFRYDVWYVDNWSLGLDLKILFLTALRVLRRQGISSKGEVTATEFLGERAE